MRYIKQITIAPSEVCIVESLGFSTELVSMHLDGTNTYNVYAKEVK